MRQQTSSHSRIHEEDVVGHGQVESNAARLEADQQYLHIRVVLECLQDLGSINSNKIRLSKATFSSSFQARLLS